MNKFVIETPKGNVNVIISDDEMHPGVIIEVANKQVARVEIDQEENNVNAYLWDETKQEDFLHKVSTPIIDESKIEKTFEDEAHAKQIKKELDARLMESNQMDNTKR